MVRRATSARRGGFTIIEITSALVLVATLIALLVWAAMSVVRSQDAYLADRTLDRVANAQLGQAMAHGWYVYGQGGSTSDLVNRLPSHEVRDVDLTHGEALDTRMVSVAVGAEGTLVLATVTPDRDCVARSYPPPTAGDPEYTEVEVEVDEACIASGLLPDHEPPAWISVGD